MQADMKDEVVHLRLDVKMAGILTEKSNGTHVLYISTIKATNTVPKIAKGTVWDLRAAYLFWEKLSEILHKYGFLTDLNNSGVSNRSMLGSRCTSLWHVDDLKISHMYSKVVNRIMRLLEEDLEKKNH